MILLNTSSTAQALSVIPRIYSSEFSLSVRDDSTNVSVFYEIINAVNSGNYLSFDNIFSPVLVENHFYDLKLYIDYNYWNTNYSFWELYDQFWNLDSEEISDIYKDRIFCTDQDVDQLNKNDYYKLNNGQYTTYNGSNNEYIVL